MILLPVISYLLKMLLLSAILLGYYHLFLRKYAAHAFNRYYLLVSVFLALQLPLLHIPLPDWPDPVKQAATALAIPRHINVPVNATVTPYQAVVNYRLQLIREARYIYMIYGGIALVFIWPLVRSIYLIRKLKREYTPERVADILLYSTPEPGSPFSFFNHLFWNEAIPTDAEKGQLIFRHELYHIRQLHSLDILVLETIRRLFWCNPFFYLVLRELKLVHEFLADRFAISSGPDPAGAQTQRSTYAEWLVWQSQGVTEAPRLVHSFYHPQVIRRVQMLLHPASTRAGKAARWLTLPMLLALPLAFVARDYGNHPRGWKMSTEDGPVLKDARLTRFFLHNLRYPQPALEQGTQGAAWIFVNMDASGSKVGGGAGTGELDTQGGKAPTLTVTSRPLNAQQKIGEPAIDTANDVFLTEVDRVSNLLLADSAIGCPPGRYYFSVVFRIEKPAQ
jgi:BlaR1 peptidase M56